MCPLPISLLTQLCPPPTWGSCCSTGCRWQTPGSAGKGNMVRAWYDHTSSLVSPQCSLCPYPGDEAHGHSHGVTGAALQVLQEGAGGHRGDRVTTAPHTPAGQGCTRHLPVALAPPPAELVDVLDVPEERADLLRPQHRLLCVDNLAQVTLPSTHSGTIAPPDPKLCPRGVPLCAPWHPPPRCCADHGHRCALTPRSPAPRGPGSWAWPRDPRNLPGGAHHGHPATPPGTRCCWSYGAPRPTPQSRCWADPPWHSWAPGSGQGAVGTQELASRHPLAPAGHRAALAGEWWVRGCRDPPNMGGVWHQGESP